MASMPKCLVQLRLYLKRGITVGEKTVFDAESIFLRILIVGQQRQLQAVSASLTRYSRRLRTATTISCYVALRRRSLMSGGVN